MYLWNVTYKGIAETVYHFTVPRTISYSVYKQFFIIFPNVIAPVAAFI